MRKDPQIYYDTLGLAPGASPVEIKRAYRQLIQRWHPDHFKPGSIMQTTAEDMTKEINEAYEQLIKRGLHKSAKPKPDLRPSPPKTGTTPPTGFSSPAWSRPPQSTPPVPPRPRRRSPFAQALARWPWRKVAVGVAAALVVAGGWIYRPRFPDGGDQRSAIGGQANPALDKNRVTEQPAEKIPAAAETIEKNRDPAAPGKIVAAEAARPASAPASLMGGGAIRAIESRATPAAPSTARADPPAVTASPRAEIPRESPLEDSTRSLHDTAEFDRLFSEASTLLTTFGRGDSMAQVIAVQGHPDAVGENVIRFGSSLVYLRDGMVTGWSDGQPRLHLRALAAVDDDLLATFDAGSTRAEVLRLQGQPTREFWNAYLFGSSVVYFENDRVSHWIDRSPALRLQLIQPIPLLSLEALRR